MAKPPPKLGKIQLQIMQILWDRGRATARQITEDLCRTKPIAHSTVQTLLRKLEVKGALTHEVEDRTFVFRPLCEQTEVTTTAAHDLLARVFHGSVYGMVAHLLQHEPVTQDELWRLRELINKENER